LDGGLREKYEPPTDINEFTHSQQPFTQAVIQKCSLKTKKLRLSKIVTPFLVFEELWDLNAVINMADDQCGTLDAKLLELLCLKLMRYQAKAARVLKMQNDGSAQSLGKMCRTL